MGIRSSLILIAVAVLLAAPLPAHARPQKGFHTGPYLMLEVGAMQEDFDYNQVTGSNVGNDFETSFGVVFGWNIWDFFSGEIQGRYATNFGGKGREHIAAANVYGKWTFIADALTDFPTLRILPFLKGGMATRVSSLSSAPGASTSTVTRFGIGPSAGGGIVFLWKKYVYFGVDVQGDFLSVDDIDRTVGGITRRLYDGGWYSSFSAMGMIGVHY